ncbi:MAG: hypothetical protein M5U19_14125 [Microthrixaceae bacterium]|nr:hypothetical protein [Microthrixaceae bacterium]
MCSAPFLEVPVVVGAEHDEREFLVLGVGEDLAAELRERWEAHRREDPACVHVVDPSVDVVAAGSDLVVAHRLDSVLLLRSSGDALKAEVRDLGAFEQPHLLAVVVGDDPWGPVRKGCGQPSLEHPRRLNGVVIGAYEHQVVEADPSIG